MPCMRQQVFACGKNSGMIRDPVVGVAQLVRVPDCDSGCRGFESHRPPHFPCALRSPDRAFAQALTPHKLRVTIDGFERAISSIGRASDS